MLERPTRTWQTRFTLHQCASGYSSFARCKRPRQSTEAGRVVESSWNANRVRVVVEAPKPAFLVVAATWYPGWKGLLDGKPVAVQRANGTLLGVALPAGARELLLEYRTSGLPAGLGLAAIGFVLLLVTATGKLLMPYHGPVGSLLGE